MKLLRITRSLWINQVSKKSHFRNIFNVYCDQIR
eukprot:UN20326